MRWNAGYALELALCGVLFGGGCGSALAQMSQTGRITGTVVGAGGQRVSTATVVVEGLAGLDGQVRRQAVGADGTFALQDLPSGAYTVRVQAPGYANTTDTGVQVAVGRTTQLALALVLQPRAEAATRASAVNESVTVNGAQSPFDTEQTSSVVNIDRDRVEELPIPSRNYLSFVLLSPAAMPENPEVAARTTTPESAGFGFGGMRPVSNVVRLDGVSDDDEFWGTSRTQLSLEAISDFQVINHGFAAETGGGAGGTIDVQTREGVNKVHGDAFMFEQNSALNSVPPLGLYPRKPEENRFRAGVALGGALQRDRLFYYAAGEQELAHGEEVNQLPASTVERLNAALAKPGPLHGLTLGTGFFPTEDQETELSGRIDAVATERQRGMLRYAFTNARKVQDAFNTDELTDKSARGSAFIADNSVNGTWSSTPDERLANTASFEVSQRRVMERTGNKQGPGAVIPGVARFGTPYAGNGRHFETHIEGEEALTIAERKHLVEAGAGMDWTRIRSAVPDGSQGVFVFPTLEAFEAGAADTAIQSSYARPNLRFGEYRAHAYVQDHWKPGHGVTVDYGLRYEVNAVTEALRLDPWNFSPRVGLAWTPRSSLVLRSGFGVFYDRYVLSTVNRIVALDGQNGSSRLVDGPAATAAYAAGSAFAVDARPSIWAASNKLRNPYSEVAMLSAEQKLPLATTLTVEYQHVHGVHLGRTTNTNLLPPRPTTLPTTPQQLDRPVFGPNRLLSAYDAINTFGTTAGSKYDGLTVTLNRQFTDAFEVLAGYAYAKTIDDASFDTEQPQNPYQPRAERALSLQDQRQRLTVSGLWLIGPDLGDPADAAANAHPGRLMRLADGLEFAPILSVTTGFRADAVTGLDTNREHIFDFAARPLGYGRNALKTPDTLDLDLRVLKMVALGPGHLDIVAESFNLLNHENVALLQTAYGSGATAQAGFRAPVATGTARRVQFSLDYEF